MMTERERFESWAKSRGNQMQMIDGEYACPITSDQWKSWQACCPDGWKCVPVEPTAEMVDAASEMYMPFGDMGAAVQAAIVYAPGGGQ
tara:strand:- start:57 stop:320 length:264 start_codon:yes stop_codon:yes gene_type:complete